jgi:hypothetical protein
MEVEIKNKLFLRLHDPAWIEKLTREGKDRKEANSETKTTKTYESRQKSATNFLSQDLPRLRQII